MNKKIYQISVIAIGLLMIGIGKLVDYFVIEQPGFGGLLEESTLGGVVTIVGVVLATVAGIIMILSKNKKK